MKSTFYGLFLLFSGLVLLSFHLLALKLFGKNAIEVLTGWLSTREHVVPTILFGMAGLLFVIFIARRFEIVFHTISSRPVDYIYLGDKLGDGIYVYNDRNPDKKIYFVDEMLTDRPSRYFKGIYDRILLMESGEGNLTRLDHQNTPRLIILSIVALAAFGFALVSMIIILKGYAIHFDQTITTEGGLEPGLDLNSFLLVLTNHAGKELKTITLIVASLTILSIVIIRFNLAGIQNIPLGSSLPLPEFVKSGNIMNGKVIESKIIPGQKIKRNRSKIFLIEFTEGFEIPVYLNYYAYRGSKAQKYLESMEKEKKAILFRIVQHSEDQSLLYVEPVYSGGNSFAD